MPIIESRLRELRAIIDKSQQAIAERAGSNQSSINRFQNDQSEASRRVLLWYANYFDVSLDYIYCRTDNPQGKLYTYTPDTLKKRMNDKEEWVQLIRMCQVRIQVRSARQNDQVKRCGFCLL